MSQTDLHDPTSSATTYPLQPAGQTRLSLNEIESLCLKAARGAGLPWGLAEEAGFAASWLAARGVDGPSVLLAYLAKPQPSGIVIRDRHWQATAGSQLCPIMLGASLDDHAGLASGPLTAPVQLDPVRAPVLLVPFLARAAKAVGQSLTLRWSDGGAVILSPEGEIPSGLLAGLAGFDALALTLSASASPPLTAARVPAKTALSAETLGGLNALSLRTTVPASDTSRRGAGAASSDND